MRTNYSQGFSLIEVLIASIILFSVIAVVSLSYRSAATSSTRATNSVLASGTVPLLLDTIEFRLKNESVDEPKSQQGVLNDFEFNWSAKVISRDGPPDRLSPEDGDVVSFADKFYLWNVELTLKKGNFEKTYTYKQITWKKPE